MKNIKNKFPCRVIAVVLCVIMTLGVIPPSAAVFAATNKFVLPAPILTNLTMFRYWGFNSESTNRNGKKPENPAKSILDLSSRGWWNRCYS